jgi:hypothetical protein
MYLGKKKKLFILPCMYVCKFSGTKENDCTILITTLSFIHTQNYISYLVPLFLPESTIKSSKLKENKLHKTHLCFETRNEKFGIHVKFINSPALEPQ